MAILTTQKQKALWGELGGDLIVNRCELTSVFNIFFRYSELYINLHEFGQMLDIFCYD